MYPVLEVKNGMVEVSLDSGFQDSIEDRTIDQVITYLYQLKLNYADDYNRLAIKMDHIPYTDTEKLCLFGTRLASAAEIMEWDQKEKKRQEFNAEYRRSQYEQLKKEFEK